VQLGASLLSPTAFALTISLAGTYEDAGSGVQFINLADVTTNYSLLGGEGAHTDLVLPTLWPYSYIVPKD
jgi:hypothetical protein